jgi:hypothetical protein
LKTQWLQRRRSSPEAKLLTLKRRRTALARAIQLLEELTRIRLKRDPELTSFISLREANGRQTALSDVRLVSSASVWPAHGHTFRK